MMTMTGIPNPQSKTDRLVWKARNEAEFLVIKKIKTIIRNDNKTVADFLLPLVTPEVEKREPSNPQTILTPEGITLSQAQREKLGLDPNEAHIFEQEVVCENCRRRHRAQVICWGKPGEFHL